VLKFFQYFVLVFSFFLKLNGQVILLNIEASSKKSEVTKLNYQKKFASKTLALKEIDNIIKSLHFKGYLLANVDTIISDSTHITAKISENNFYKWSYLKLGNLNPNLASKIGISEKLYFNKPFKYKEVAKCFEKIISYYENNGYPFTSVTLDSIVIADESISAVLNVQKGKLFKIDSVIIMGNAKVNKQFLYKYLSIKPSMPFNEEIIKSISTKIRQLPFIVEKQAQQVRLTNKTNKLLLFLDKKNASQFDGIIGFLPDNVTKKTVVTGDIKLKVVNGIFKNGETIDVQWRRLQSQTQDFKGRIIYPYLFGTPVGTDYSLKIYKRDTTFIDITNNIGLQYYFSGLNNFKVFYKQRNTNLISTSGYSLITTLPEYADITTQSYGAGFTFEKLNYRFNPRKGVALNINAQTGNRIIKKNPKVNEIAYTNLLLRSTQYQLEGDLNFFIPIYNNNVLHFGVQGASVFGNSSIFKNELFRIGGLRTLRGFDEESIYASSYVIPTIEYRFLFAQNSNLLLFAEGAWYENNSNNLYLKDTPVSVGAGINFETKAGILSLNYAIGNQFGNGFDPRSGKIHFGLTALF
jgi:outer membrane protein assembly factor BamA